MSRVPLQRNCSLCALQRGNSASRSCTIFAWRHLRRRRDMFFCCVCNDCYANKFSYCAVTYGTFVSYVTGSYGMGRSVVGYKLIDAPPKHHWTSIRLRSITSQKTEDFIVTDVRTTNWSMQRSPWRESFSFLNMKHQRPGRRLLLSWKWMNHCPYWNCFQNLSPNLITFRSRSSCIKWSIFFSSEIVFSRSSLFTFPITWAVILCLFQQDLWRTFWCFSSCNNILSELNRIKITVFGAISFFQDRDLEMSGLKN